MPFESIDNNRVPRTNVLGVGVSSINMDEAVQLLLDARANGKMGYVCVTGVHGVIESQRDPELKKIHNASFLTVPDGMPTVWMGREQGFVHMGRVYGPDLMLKVFEKTSALNQRAEDGGRKPAFDSDEASVREESDLRSSVIGSQSSDIRCESNYLYPSQEETGGLDIGGERIKDDGRLKTARPGGRLGDPSRPQQPSVNSSSTEEMRFTHFLYGSTPEVLAKLKANLEAKFPGSQIVGTYSPPFRPLTDDEELELQGIVSACKPDFFWVGLSTPKQERFMYAHCTNMNAEGGGRRAEDCSLTTSNQQPATVRRFPLDAGIMLGVGAAFDIHAGFLKDAPEWVKNSGLQWFYRLCQEPKRLWRRYLDIVPRFLWLAALQMLGMRKYSIEE